MLIEELQSLRESTMTSKKDLFLKHERAVAAADFYTNDSENMSLSKAKKAEAQAEKILKKAESLFDANFAKDVDAHTQQRLDALYSGVASKEGSGAAKIRDKHAISHVEYSSAADVGVHPSLLKRKDAPDEKEVRKKRETMLNLDKLSRAIELLTNKKSTSSQVAQGEMEIKALKDKVISQLQAYF
jgi:hypothetical protein